MKAIIPAMFCLSLLSTPVLAQDGSTVETEVLVKSSVSWDGTPLKSYPAGVPEITILRIKIPPGVSLPMHKHPVINGGLLLRGHLTVMTEDSKTLHLKAGDAIVELVNTWHYGRNDGDTVAEILVFYAGVADMPITVKR